MEIKFDYQKQDLLAYAEYVAAKHPATRNARMSAIFYTMLIATLFGLLVAVIVRHWAPLAVCLIAGAVVAWRNASTRAMLQRSKQQIESRPAQVAGFFGPCSMRATPEGLHTTWPDGAFSSGWAGVTGILQSNDLALFEWQNNVMFVLPRRGVREGDFDAFVSACRQYLAQGTTVASA